MKWKTILILLVIVMSVSSSTQLIAQEISQEITEYTVSTERSCINKICNLILYSGTRFIKEDKIWKRVEDAKSLMGHYEIVYLKNDNDHKIKVVDFNYTSITFDLTFTGELSKYDYNLIDNKINTQFKINETMINFTTLRPYDVISKNNIQVVPNKDFNYIYNNNPLSKRFSFGEKSTTVILQEAETYNTDDTKVERVTNPNDNFGLNAGLYTDANRDWISYIKWNLSGLPSGITILESYLYLFETNDDGTTVDIYHVMNDTWVEGSFNAVDCSTPSDCENGIIGGTRHPCGDAFNKVDSCNLTVEYQMTSNGVNNEWDFWNITNMTIRDFANKADGGNFSMVLRDNTGTTDQMFFSSKDRGIVAERPYLNITYLEAPVDTCTYSSGDWIIDCSDDCIITSDTSLPGNDIHTYGSGTLTIRALIDVRNIFNRCDLFCYNTPSCFG